ncbi:MAG: IS30 family transposase [Candidatus Eremiobacteraeota bacterium]|nr:IS30 family transposase [Candidatus Eremiobacteraeota bacterium]MBC5825544.1 IS30 family transposase [Candidatus Eremiobacteraeota bacterium]
MAHRGRPGLSYGQKQELWARWQRGESTSDISRALNTYPASIHTILRKHGGIAPRERARSQSSLSLPHREEISRGIAAQRSVRTIAASIGVAPSTVSRELERNGGAAAYRAAAADERAWHEARRPKPCRLATNRRLRALVAAKLLADWSPQQIAGWLTTEFPDDADLQISHETIYRTLFVQTRGALKNELIAHLRSGRVMRRSTFATNKGQPRGAIIDAVSIRERPAEAEDRAVPGHWEGDLLAGARNSHIATLVERRSRFVMLVKVPGKDTTSVVSALSKQMTKLPASLRQSLTWDRGMELAAHKRFTIVTKVPVYFCDPKSPWQRGSNENTNRLLRQYFPDGTELSQFSQRGLDRIALKLNRRPRKTLSYHTPAATLSELLR